MSRTSERNDIEHFSRWSRTYEDSWLQKFFFDCVHQTAIRLFAFCARDCWGLFTREPGNETIVEL